MTHHGLPEEHRSSLLLRDLESSAASSVNPGLLAWRKLLPRIETAIRNRVQGGVTDCPSYRTVERECDHRVFQGPT